MPAYFSQDAEERARRVELVLMDVDGVLTDGQILLIPNGNGGVHEMKAFDVDGTSLRRGRTFAKLDIPGTSSATAADGIRCDVDGNVWAGARPGVQILTPGGERIGMIRLPENCSNVCFGGLRRNRLFMTASQSLYAVYTNAQGAL